MTLSYEAQAKQHAHAVRMRLMGEPKRSMALRTVSVPQMHVDAPHGPYDVGSKEWAQQRYPNADLVMKHGFWMPRLRAGRKVFVDMTIDKFGVNYENLMSDCRLVLVVKARNYCVWMLRTHLRLSLEDMASFFGKDHSTIIHSIRSHARRVVIMRGRS